MIKKNKLALFGGSKTINYQLDKFNFIDHKEIESVNKVLKSGILSGFYANKNNFLGGKNVLLFENNIKKYFGTKYAVTFNSWTSGLIACVGALNIEPGDEIILPAWTMSACAMSILHWGGIPVFSDIEDKTFNLDPNKIENKITKKTKAIMVVDIFGHPADFESIKKISKKYKLKIIEDAAQSIGAKYKNKYVGTYSDLGGFSFNAHKHIQTGEGGVVLTNNRYYAKKLQLIRNHGEAIVGHNKRDLINMIGYNFRPTEIDAAIGIEQLKKLKKIVNSRVTIAKKLSIGLKNLPFITVPKIQKNCTHSFYVYSLKIESKLLNIQTKKIFEALLKEGIPGLSFGYLNLNELPIFKKKIAYGSKKFPWSINKNYDYSKNILPVTERLHNSDLIKIGLCRYNFDNKDVTLIIRAFKKVWEKLVIPSSKYHNLTIKILNKKKDVTSSWINWLNDKEITKYSRQKNTKHTKKKQFEYLKKTTNSKYNLLYGIFLNNKHVGNIEFSKIDNKTKTCEIKFLMGEKKLWNKGFMSFAVNKALNIIFSKYDLASVYGGCNMNNIGSVKVFEKNLFKKVRTSKDNIFFKLKISNYKNFNQ